MNNHVPELLVERLALGELPKAQAERHNGTLDQTLGASGALCQRSST